MADMMQFDLVSPEKMLASAKVSAVDLPGSEGDMTAMPGHAPMVISLRPGVLRADSGGEISEFVVTSGFVEINAGAVSVLAEKAIPRELCTREEIQALIEAAREKAAAAEPDTRDIGEKLVADLVHLLDMMD